MISTNTETDNANNGQTQYTTLRALCCLHNIVLFILRYVQYNAMYTVGICTYLWYCIITRYYGPGKRSVPILTDTMVLTTTCSSCFPLNGDEIGREISLQSHDGAEIGDCW